ncbi:MAG: hypothetical protein JOY79_01925, partial [Acidobacteriaceae bacterium]|nr:hypothetical protein [Acidobacteriaceae bacterium]
MRFRKFPARLVVPAIVLVLLAPAAQGLVRGPNFSYKLFNQTPDTQSTTDTPYTAKASTAIDISCPNSGAFAQLSSSPDPNPQPVFTDNWIQLDNGNAGGPFNVCTGGDPNGPGANDPNFYLTHSTATNCFKSSYESAASGLFGTFISTTSFGIGPLDISGYLTGGVNHLQFALINDGGPFGNSDIYLVTNCGRTQTTRVEYTQGQNVSNTVIFNSDGPIDQKHSIKATFDNVNSTFHVDMTATEMPANGLCNIPGSGNANDSSDFDCTLANFFGDQPPSYNTFPYTYSGSPTVHVPYCLHYSHGNCVDVEAKLVDAQGNSFSGFVHIYIAWNADTASLFPYDPVNAPDSYWGTDKNAAIPQLYDAPH